VVGRLRSGISSAKAEAALNVTVQQFLVPGLVERIGAPSVRVVLEPGRRGSAPSAKARAHRCSR
jgi:hypothetical protein